MKLRDIKPYLVDYEWIQISDFTNGLEIVYEGFCHNIPNHFLNYEVYKISAFNSMLDITVKGD